MPMSVEEISVSCVLRVIINGKTQRFPWFGKAAHRDDGDVRCGIRIGLQQRVINLAQ